MLIVVLDSLMKLQESRQKTQLRGIHCIQLSFTRCCQKRSRKAIEAGTSCACGAILAIEKFLMDTSNLPYMRLHAWFMALQNWATPRFSDHREILPESISWGPSGFAAVLSRSKTLGSDKNVLSRPLRVDNSCFVGESSWRKTGLQILRELAPFSRDYLIPAPEKNFSGCRHMELKYEIGYAVQNRVMSLLKLTQILFQSRSRPFGHLIAVVAVQRWISLRRNGIIWGAGSPEGSDRYARIAGLRISNLQCAVARTIRQGPQGDTLCERETLQEFEDFMLQKNVTPETLS